jgi:hypothetical protein
MVRAFDQPASRGGTSRVAVEPPPEALCRNCRYALRGLADPRCPECGEPFDPCDIGTMYLPTWHGWLARRFLKPAGVVMYAWAMLGALFIYWLGHWDSNITIGRTAAAGYDVVLPKWVPIDFFYMSISTIAGWVWFLLLVAWVIRACARRLVVEMYRLPIEKLFVDRPARRFASACFILGLLLGGPSTDRCTHGEYWEFWRTLGVVHESPTGQFATEHCKWSLPIGGEWLVYWRR